MEIAKRRSHVVQVVSAVAIGASGSLCGALVWGILPRINPVTDWLMDVLAKQGRDFAYVVCVSVHDVLVNLILVAPFALVLSKIRFNSSWLALVFGLSGFLVASYWPVLPRLAEFASSVGPGRLALNIFLSVGPLALTYSAFRFRRKRAT